MAIFEFGVGELDIIYVCVRIITDINIQKKMNARTKDALDETLILSGK